MRTLCKLESAEEAVAEFVRPDRRRFQPRRTGIEDVNLKVAWKLTHRSCCEAERKKRPAVGYPKHLSGCSGLKLGIA